MRLPDLTLRVRLIAVGTLVLAAISLWICIYFPDEVRRHAMLAIVQKADTVAEITAFGVSPALVFDDVQSAEEVLAGARQSRDVLYAVVVDPQGNTFAAAGEEVAAKHAFLDTPAGGAIAGGGAVYKTYRTIHDQGREIGRLYVGMSLDAVNNQTRAGRVAVALASFLVFMVGIVCVIVVSRLITRPLDRIVDTAERIAGGDLSKRVPVSSEDEFGHLARSFNIMVDRVESAYHALADLNRDLEQRVEGRTRELQEEIEERREKERLLRDSEARYRLLFERNLAGVFRQRLGEAIIDCNDACARILGYENRRELVGRKIEDHIDGAEQKELLSTLVRSRGLTNAEVRIRRADGVPIWVLANVTLLPQEPGLAPLIEATIADITARRDAEQQVEFQAYHDSLTELPNRTLFEDRLSTAIPRAKRRDERLAVMFLDLDRFKDVNDTFGHSAGDRLLQAVAARLHSCIRAEDTVARLGGDEFTVLVTSMRSETDAARVAEQILGILAQPIVIEGEELYVTGSLGIATYPTDGTDPETLLKNADSAMYQAKEAGRNNYQFCTSEISQRAAERLSIESALRRAIRNNELLIHYQPQVNLQTWEIVSVEALLRWDHPTRGLMAPAQFVPIAEETRLIIPIGEWVLETACREANAWRSAGARFQRVAVNLSARQFQQADLVRTVERVLRDTGMDASLLELEVTESTAMLGSERTIAQLRQLKEMKIHLSIDDFGTGHSSLAYLNRFPIDRIKIDKSFIRNTATDRSAAALVKAMVAMSHSLGLRVVAEGVETQEEIAILRQCGCEEVQGNIFSPPMPAAEIRELLRGTPPGRLLQISEKTATPPLNFRG